MILDLPTLDAAIRLAMGYAVPPAIKMMVIDEDGEGFHVGAVYVYDQVYGYTEDLTGPQNYN